MTDKPHIGCLASILTLLLTPFFCLLHGWYLMLMWNWFMVLPPISWKAAVGLTMVIHFLKIRHHETKNPPWSEMLRQVAVIQVSTAISVLFGLLFWLAGFGNH